MKKLILIFLTLIAISSYGQQKISDMPEASSLNSSDIFPIVQSGSNKKVTFSVLSSYYQPIDADLSAIAALSTTGFLQRTGVNTWSTASVGGISGLSANRIPYATSSTALANGPYFDATNIRIGIGASASSPATSLHIAGADANNIRMETTSGLGTSQNSWEVRMRDLVEGDFGIYDRTNSRYGIYFSGDGNIATVPNLRISSTPTNSQSVLTLLSRDNAASGQVKTFTLSSYAATLLDDAAAVNARSTLGLVIGTDVQAWSLELDALGGLSSGSNLLPYFTGIGSATTTTLSTFGRSLIDDANSATAQATLDLEIGTDVQAYDADLDAIAALSGLGFPARSAANTWVQRSIAGSTNIGVSNATGASGNPSIFLNNAALNSIGGLTTGINQMIFTTSSNTYATTSLTTFARTLLDDTDAATARATFEIEEGTFTPTVTGITNVDSESSFNANYMKVGDMVTVSGVGIINATSTSTATVFELSLPFATDIIGNNQAVGTATINETFPGVTGAGLVRGEPTSDTVEVLFTSLTASTQTVYFHFTYNLAP